MKLINLIIIIIIILMIILINTTDNDNTNITNTDIDTNDSTRKGIGRQGIGSFCREILCFSSHYAPSSYALTCDTSEDTIAQTTERLQNGPQGKILHTRNHKREIASENATDNPLDNYSKHPLGK